MWSAFSGPFLFPLPVICEVLGCKIASALEVCSVSPSERRKTCAYRFDPRCLALPPLGSSHFPKQKFRTNFEHNKKRVIAVCFVRVSSRSKFPNRKTKLLKAVDQTPLKVAVKFSFIVPFLNSKLYALHKHETAVQIVLP